MDYAPARSLSSLPPQMLMYAFLKKEYTSLLKYIVRSTKKYHDCDERFGWRFRKVFIINNLEKCEIIFFNELKNIKKMMFTFCIVYLSWSPIW